MIRRGAWPMVACLAVAACQTSGAHPTVSADFTTPEGAVLMLQRALSDQDLDGAIGCRDFVTAARLMLERRRATEDPDDALVAKNADVLREAFVEEIQRQGFPDYSQTLSTFVSREPFRGRQDRVVVSERVTLSDHTHEVLRYLVGRGSDGWRVLGPAD